MFVVCGIVIVVLLCIIGVLLFVLLRYGNRHQRRSTSGIATVPSRPEPQFNEINKMHPIHSASFNSPPIGHPIPSAVPSNHQLYNSMPLLHVNNGSSMQDLSSINELHSNAVANVNVNVTEIDGNDPDEMEEGSVHSDESSSFSVDGAEIALQDT